MSAAARARRQREIDLLVTGIEQATEELHECDDIRRRATLRRDLKAMRRRFHDLIEERDRA